MKTERLNCVIFTLCCVTFILQSVGYLSPAWFVREYNVHHGAKGFQLDGKRFMLIDSESVDVGGMSDVLLPTSSGDGTERKRRNLDLQKDEPDDKGSVETSNKKKDDGPKPNFANTVEKNGEKDDAGKEPTLFPGITQDRDTPQLIESDTTDSDAPTSSGPGKPADSGDFQKDEPDDKGSVETSKKKNDNGPKPNFANTVEKDSEQDDAGKEPTSFPGITHDKDTPQLIESDTTDRGAPTSSGPGKPADSGSGNSQNIPTVDTTKLSGIKDKNVILDDDPTDSFPEEDTTNLLDKEYDMYEDQIAQTDEINPSKPVHGSDMVTMDKARKMEKFITRKRILHVTAGLWYGRTCMNSRDTLTGTDGVKGTEWCTMYIRTNGSTLDNQKDVFEFRIEASLGLGICLLGLLVASSACCSQPRQGTRMVFSLLCMFVSGAVMLVPVVHMIVQHQHLSGLFHRQRPMSRFMVHSYVQHDLFDHWSVVLCGCGSIISVIGSILFMVIGCRHQKPDGTRYDLSMSEKGSVTTKRELPVQWARNNKITIPSSTLTVSESPDSLEAEDSDYHTETKDEDCPSEGISQDEAADVDGTSVDKGNESDVIETDETGYDVMTRHENEIDYFEHVLEDD